MGEIYPDSSGGSDQITYTYNRQQQVLVVTDQGGTEHTYAYDALGRVTQDRATALGSGVDGTVRRIGRTYDARGLVESVSSYDNPAVGSGTVLNAVQFAYNGFGQLITEYQSTGGSVNTSTTPRVEYDYASGADNTIRPTLLTYPNGRELMVDYGTAGGMDDQLSRVSALVDDDDTTLAAYSYLGLGSVVQQSSPEADLLYTLAAGWPRLLRNRWGPTGHGG